MAKYYETYKPLIMGCAVSGLYFSPVKKVVRSRYILAFYQAIPILPLILLPFQALCSIKYLIFDNDKFGGKLYALAMVAFSSLSTFVVYYFHLGRNKYVRLWEKWSSMYKDDLYQEEREELLKTASHFTNTWFRFFHGFSAVSCIIYSSINFFSEDKDLGHPFGIPYRHQSPDFELVNMFELIMGTFAFLTLITYDSIAMVFLSLEYTQLKHLRLSLGRILNSIAVTDYGYVYVEPDEKEFDYYQVKNYRNRKEKIYEETKEKMRLWIKHHQSVLEFHEEVQRIYAPVFSFKHIAFIYVLCVVAFLLTTNEMSSKDILGAFAYIATNYLTHYVNIKIADSITEEGECIFSEGFSKTWYLCPKDLVSDFQMILIRSQRPIHFYTLKVFPMNSRSFRGILTSAYTYFTFLLQISKKGK